MITGSKKKKIHFIFHFNDHPTIARDLYDTFQNFEPKNFFQSYILLIASMFDDKHTWSNSIIRFPRASNPICTSSSHTVKLVRRARHTTDHMYQILKFLDWPQLPLGIPNIWQILKTLVKLRFVINNNLHRTDNKIRNQQAQNDIKFFKEICNLRFTVLFFSFPMPCLSSFNYENT